MGTPSVDPSLTETLCKKHGLPHALVCALIQQESGGNLYAIRAEPSYPYVWDVHYNKPFRKLSREEANLSLPPSDFRSASGSRLTEWQGQRSSWGPMQLMGAVARELGFTGYFPELCGEAGLDFSIRHLENLWKRFHPRYGLDGVIAAYNAGSPRHAPDSHKFVNQGYVDSVRQLMDNAAFP